MIDVSPASSEPRAEVACLDVTLAGAAENLALDEALLEACDAGEMPATLRFWEPKEVFVVVGYANVVEREVNLDACRAAQLCIFRRCSGGGTVVQMPGVLNYNWVCRIPERGPLSNLAGTNSWVMSRVRESMERLPGLRGRLAVRGITDLCLGDRKCVGNAQRRKRNALLFHGSILLHANLDSMETFLRMPSVQPEYRGLRGHGDFCCNLEVEASAVKAAMRDGFGAAGDQAGIPWHRVRHLIADRYSRPEWNEKR